MTQSRPMMFVVGIALTAALLACGLGTPLPPKPTAAPETPTRTPGAVKPTRAPTLLPTPTENLAPTPLPAPTKVIPPTAAPTEAGGTPGSGGGSSGPSITLNPAIGEPLEVTIVNGTGWPPSAHVTLAWGAPSKPGPKYWELDADANGTFSVGLKVPPGDKWPGGPPTDRTLLQLRATSDLTGANFVWANFTYIKLFIPPTKGSPVGPSATPKPTGTPTPKP